MKKDIEKDFFAIRDSLENLISKLTSEIEEDVKFIGGKNMTAIESINKTREKLKGQTFQIAVVALAKSGKSTLINSWLGNEFLPSAHIPETARIIRIIHNNKLPTGTLQENNKLVAKNAKEINLYLRKKNSESRDSDILPEKNEIILEASIQTLSDKELGDFKFEILDTPGPNEAGKEILEASVHRILKDADVFIYLLDYTKLKTNEEKDLWLKLKSLRSELLNEYQGRLFFAVNKIDLKDRNGSSNEETAKYISDYLKAQIDLDVSPEKVISVSAEYALLSRMVINCLADDRALDNFKKHVFGIAITDEKKAWDCEQCRRFAENLLEESYMNELESKVIEYLFKNRKIILQNTVVDNISKTLGEFENQLKISDALTKQDKNKIESAKKKLIKKKNSINSKLSEIQTTADEFESNIMKEFNTKFDNFKTEMTEIIESIDLEYINSRDKSKAMEHLKKQNSKFEKISEKEFDKFFVKLEKAVSEKREELDKKFSGITNQLENEFTDEISRIFNIGLNKSPILIHANYSLSETGKIIDKLLTGKTDGGYLKKKGGWCGKDEYSQEYTKYSINIEEFIDIWKKNIEKMTKESKVAARNAIKEAVINEVDKYKTKINNKLNEYLIRIEKESHLKEKGKKIKEERITFINEKLNCVEEIKEELGSIKKHIQKV